MQSCGLKRTSFLETWETKGPQVYIPDWFKTAAGKTWNRNSRICFNIRVFSSCFWLTAHNKVLHCNIIPQGPILKQLKRPILARLRGTVIYLLFINFNSLQKWYSSQKKAWLKRACNVCMTLLTPFQSPEDYKLYLQTLKAVQKLKKAVACFQLFLL